MPTSTDTVDPFAPARYSFDYLFAITLAAQPLAWMEASNLPGEAYATASLLKAYQSLATPVSSRASFCPLVKNLRDARGPDFNR